MKSFTPKTVVAVSTFLLATNVVLADNDEPVGCYSTKSSMDNMEKADTFTYQSIGHCRGLCTGKNKPLLALTSGSDCYCTDKVPSQDSKTSDDDCSKPCDGYPQNICGGSDSFSVYLTGQKPLKDIDTVGGGGGGDSSSTSSDNSNGPTTTTSGGETVVVTASDKADSEKADDDGGGPNTAGIAAGVVVGVVALVAIIGGIWFYMRRKQRKAMEYTHARTANIDNFVAGGKPNSSSSMSDSRLDPSMMAHRRQSDGSIADNQDFSRRILQVTNPDGH